MRKAPADARAIDRDIQRELRATAPRDARALAREVIRDVVFRRLALDERLERMGADEAFRVLSPSDRGLARAIPSSALRGLGYIRKALADRLAEGVPANSGDLEAALIAGAAQILFLDVPDYAAVDTTVAFLKTDRRSERYAKLANAVLRGISRDAVAILAGDPLAINTPGWLAERWTRAYGEETARAIARAHLDEPPLDLSVKSDAAGWAERLKGYVTPAGGVRLRAVGAIPGLDGFDEGAWWVQDAAAAIPARLLNVQAGERVLDLCAAPGGKTAQLASAGAEVVAVDRSGPRLKRLVANLDRLGLTADVHTMDAAAFAAPPFPAILLDAPCSATGTIRRHPDVAWNKTLADVASLSETQARLLDHAWTLLAPGGRLVYATCALEPEEGERQIAAFLARTPGAALVPVTAEEAGAAEMVSPEGYFRALPAHMAETGGCDGFFAARIVKSSG